MSGTRIERSKANRVSLKVCVFVSDGQCVVALGGASSGGGRSGVEVDLFDLSGTWESSVWAYLWASITCYIIKVLCICHIAFMFVLLLSNCTFGEKRIFYLDLNFGLSV